MAKSFSSAKLYFCEFLKLMQRLPKGGFEVSGPSCPPIFIAHLPSSGLNAAQEIFFGYKVKIEGIHVVPNLTSPPGLPFLGRTKPDLSQGPFNLEIFGRNCVTNELVNYLAVNIHGGVQWIAVPLELRDMEINYLACSGSYDEVSIIFHGLITETSSSTESTEKVFPPHPHFLQLLSFSHDSREGKVAKKGVKDKVATLLPTLTSDQTPETLQQNIIRNITPAGKTFSVGFKSKVLSSRSYVSFPIEPCASIVERGFEMDLQTAFQAPEAIISHMHTFADLLQSCYDGKDDIHIEKSEMHNLLEEETVTVLSTALTHGLQLFYGYMNQSEVDQVKFVELGGLLLRYTRLLLANETTNGILRENGTWTSLLSLIRVMPSLQTSIRQSYLAMILDGCSFLSLLNEFISPTISGSSPYQDLIIVSMQLSPTDTQSTTLVTQILGQIAVYENIQNFVSCAEEGLSSIEIVAQKINWRHATYEKIASDEAGDDATDALSRSNEEDIRERSEFNEAVLSAIEPADQLIKQTQALLTVWKHFNEVKSITKSDYEQLGGDEEAIIQFMEKNDFFPAIAALIHVTAVSRELRQVIDNLLPQRQEIISMINELQQVLADMHLMLKSLKCYEAMMIHYGELLLAPLSSPCNNDPFSTWKEEIQVILSLSWSSLQFLTLSKKVVNDEECDLEAVLTHGTLLINGLTLHRTQAIAHQVIEKHLLADVILLLEKLLRIESELLSVDLRLVHDILVNIAEKLLTLYRPELNSVMTKQAYEAMKTSCQLLKQKDIERSRDLQVVDHDTAGDDVAMMKVDEIQASATVESQLDSTLSQAHATLSSIHLDSNHDNIELSDYQLSEAIKPLLIELKTSYLISKLNAKQFRNLIMQLSKTIKSRQRQQQQQNNRSSFRILTVECRLQMIRQVIIRNLNVCVVTINLAIASVFLSSSSLTVALATLERDTDLTQRNHNQLLSAMKSIDDVRMIIGNAIDIMLAIITLMDSIELVYLPHDVSRSLLRVLFDAILTLSQPAVIAIDQATFTNRKAAFETKVASFIARSSVLHEALCEEVHRMIQRALPDERATLIQLLTAIIRKVDEKDRDLPHMLLTYYPQHENVMAENTKSLAKFVIESLSSQAVDVQDAVLQFILAFTQKCSTEVCALVYYELVMSIQSITTRYLQTVNTDSTSSNSSKAILQSVLIRSLVIIEQLFLVDNSLPMLLLLQQGVLHLLLLLVHAEVNVSLVAQQCLWASRGRLESLSHHVKAGPMKERLRGVADMIAIGLVEVLPQIMKRCQDSTSCLMQGVHIIHALPTHHLWLPFFKRLAAVGEGFTIEFISIKIWTAFEEAFQALHEGSEIRKQLTSHATVLPFEPEQVENVINMAHARFACASFTLKAILEIVLWAYESQRISLLTVTKAARSALADCRKVIIRYQRIYTMWSTAIIGDTRNTEEVNDDQFEARHALISLSLRHLVEITNKITRYSLAREEKFSQAALHQARDQSLVVEEHWNEMLMMIDLQRPFGEHEDSFQERLLDLSNHPIMPASNEIEAQVSLLHHDLRKLALDSSTNIPTHYKDRLLALATADGWEEEVIRRKRKLVSVIYPGSGLFAEQAEETEKAQPEEVAITAAIPPPQPPMHFASPPMPLAPGSVDRKLGMIPPPPVPPPMPPFQMNRPAAMAGIPPPPMPPVMPASLVPPPPIPPTRFPFPASTVAAVIPAPPVPPQFAQAMQPAPINLIQPQQHQQQQQADYYGGMTANDASYNPSQVAVNENAASLWESHPMMAGVSAPPTASARSYDQMQNIPNAFMDPQQMQVQQSAYDQQQPYLMQNSDSQQYHNVNNGHTDQPWQQQQQQHQQYQQQQRPNQQAYQDRPQGRFGGQQQGGDQGFGGRGRGGRGRGRGDQSQDGGRGGRGGRGRGDYEGDHNNKFQRRDDGQSGGSYCGNQQRQPDSQHQSQPSWPMQQQQPSQPWQQATPIDPHQQFMIPMISPSTLPPAQFPIQQQQQGGQQQHLQPRQDGGQRQAYRRS